MSVKLRLKRLGRSHRNFFRLSVMDTRTARDGRVIEELGWYDPGAPAEDKRVSLNRERIEFWLGNGALPSPTVSELLEKNGIASPKAK